MEQFIYTNINGDSLTISYSHSENILKGYDGLTAAEVLPETVQGYNQQGYGLQRTRLGSRVITIEFLVYAADMEALYEKRKQLGKVFNSI